jgi:hypothetical protein
LAVLLFLAPGFCPAWLCCTRFRRLHVHTTTTVGECPWASVSWLAFQEIVRNSITARRLFHTDIAPPLQCAIFTAVIRDLWRQNYKT